MTHAANGETRPRYGWGWIDGEDEQAGNRWIAVAELHYETEDENEEGTLQEELCALLVRDFREAARKSPTLIHEKERLAQMIVDALNQAIGRSPAVQAVARAVLSHDPL